MSDDLLQKLSQVWSFFTHRDGRLQLRKIIFVAILSLMFWFYKNSNEILKWYDAYNREEIRQSLLLEQEVKKNELLVETLPLVIGPLADYIEADLVTVFKYFPEGKRTYNKLLYYVGELPTGTRFDDYQRILTEHTHPSVIAHMKGIPYRPLLPDGQLLPIAKPLKMYVYGCPIYNSRAVYDGVVAFYWNEIPSDWDGTLIYSSCSKAAREIGMYI